MEYGKPVHLFLIYLFIELYSTTLYRYHQPIINLFHLDLNWMMFMMKNKEIIL